MLAKILCNMQKSDERSGKIAIHCKLLEWRSFCQIFNLTENLKLVINLKKWNVNSYLKYSWINHAQKIIHLHCISQNVSKFVSKLNLKQKKIVNWSEILWNSANLKMPKVLIKVLIFFAKFSPMKIIVFIHTYFLKIIGRYIHNQFVNFWRHHFFHIVKIIVSKLCKFVQNDAQAKFWTTLYVTEKSPLQP